MEKKTKKWGWGLYKDRIEIINPETGTATFPSTLTVANTSRGGNVTNLHYEIIKEALGLLRKFPEDKEVYKEQSKIIRRVLRELNPEEGQ